MKIWIILLITIVSRLGFAQCPGTPPAGIDCVASGANKDIMAFSTCKKITNAHTSAKALMVPIKTSTEWSTFYGAPPAGVTVAACTTSFTYRWEFVDTYYDCGTVGGSVTCNASTVNQIGVYGDGSPTLTGTTSLNGPYSGGCAGGGNDMNRYICTAVPVSQANPTALALTHSTRNRTFTVSWSAGVGNGGASGCRLQFLKDGATWTNLSGSFDCDSNATNVAASLPSTDNWTNSSGNWNSSGVSVRLQRISDSAVLGSFTQKLTCTTTGSSGSSTPNIDEDCNREWNNTVQNETNHATPASCYVPLSTLTPGAYYTCPNPGTCDGKVVRGLWYAGNGVSLDGTTQHWYNGQVCTGPADYTYSGGGMTFATLSPSYGPSYSDGFIPSIPAQFDGTCRFWSGTTYRKQTPNVYGQWSSGTCLYYTADVTTVYY